MFLHIGIIFWRIAVSQEFMHRIKIPQGRVHGIVERFGSLIREHIRHQSVFYIHRKGRKDIPRLIETLCRKRKSGQRDHRIPAPVRKPRQTRKHGSKPGGLAVSQKLIRRKH